MMPGVSELWDEIGGGGGGFNAVAPWKFEALSENLMADSSWMSSQREMESLTRALQRELCSANYENELNFAASSLRSFKARNGGGSNNIYDLDGKIKKSTNTVTEMINSSNGGFEEKGTKLFIEKGLNFNKAERFKSEPDSLRGRNSNYLSVNGAGKVSKRKSRAASKTPITFLNADPANFRAMVQQVTGVPLNPNTTRLWPPATGAVTFSPLLKPEPKRPCSSSSASIIQGLPTLDTSALFIHSARQNPASAADFSPFSSSAAAAVAAHGNEIFLTEKLRAACMKNNGGGGADFEESAASIVVTEADSWLNASNFEGVLSGSGGAAGSLPM